MVSDVNMVNIFIMGKKYEVPDSLTIMNAMEYAGYQLVRGCGCRAGFCGACATVYRLEGDYDLKVGLACQTQVEENMYLTQIPFFPAQKLEYNLQELKPTAEQIAEFYPEIYRCIGCNACTKICPQDLKVMQYVGYAQRGQIDRCADESFDCVMCGLCASRCPAQITQFNVGILARRLYSRHIAPPAEHLQKRVEEVESGKYEAEFEELMKASKAELRERYGSRDIEK
ncbi:4Fe-4S dicluster domain-containing protein [Dethiobacter alkaliphilus]|uniref:4Fe-4S dicluster domain-containing protein n=1 Tax=Dethiobacter alkaliphilus TaxID=427926 RepID=UPI0022269C4C|nr:4Fe-4S dicluster domain-containing protein [Dethiobacter alkaliphilus]